MCFVPARPEGKQAMDTRLSEMTLHKKSHPETGWLFLFVLTCITC